MNREWMTKSSREDKLLFAGGFMSLKELDKMPNGDAKNEVLNNLEIAKTNHNPNADYGKNGSRFTDKFLEEIGGIPILYPLDWMADFILLEHKTKIDNNDKELLSVFSQYLKSSDLYYVFMYMKPQLLGLCAYTVLNIKDDDVFNSALEFLDLYQKYYLACMTNDREGLSKQVDEHEKWLKSLN